MVSWDMVTLSLSYALVCVWYSWGVVTWDPLHPPFIRVVPGQDHRRIIGGDPRIGKGGAYRGAQRGLLNTVHRGGERRGLLNQALIKLDPQVVIERDGSDQLPRFAIGGDKAGIGKLPLRDHHFLGRRGDAHRFDVDPELTGPESRHGHVRAASGGGTDHIMRGDGSLLHRIAPMFQRQKLVVVEGMREAGDIPGDKDIIGDNRIDIEGTAPGVTADPKRPR